VMTLEYFWVVYGWIETAGFLSDGLTNPRFSVKRCSRRGIVGRGSEYREIGFNRLKVSTTNVHAKTRGTPESGCTLTR
jgi:hypothetical protein